MKKISLMIVGLLLLVGANAQISQLGGIDRVHYSRGDRPLEGKEYDYRIFMTGGKSAVWVRLICKNGVFTIDNSTIYNTNVLNSFSLKVKWGSAGPGEIYAEDSNGYKAVYRVNVEKPGISISGPSSTKYNDYAEYSISVNPNISIKSATWNNSQEFKYISGQGTSNYKVQVVKNDKKSVNNAIEVTAQTDYGVFYANKNVSIEPVFAITTNQTTVYSGDYVSYSINAISGAVITWESVNNMALISGQGTSTAIFKASGNGTGTVKATVTYEGKSYTVENSDVWVGAPLKPLITPVFSKFFAGSSYDVMITNVSPGSKVTWDISGATITSQTENSVLIKVANFDLDASVFIIATVENKCGSSRSSISIPVKGLGGGGGVYPEI